MILSRYTKNIILISGLILCLLVAFSSSFSKLANIWQQSNTYGHGFLILPVALWLINRKKNLLAQVNAQPSILALFVLGLASTFWFVSVLSYINVIEQFALFSLFVILTWAFFGWKVVLSLKFPLAFIYFSIPIGDFLIPYLQFVTADISVYMISILGIPVFRDGMYIQIPNGNFVVAEACSGIRFLISTITIGTLYSYLNFTKLYKQILFVIICCVVAILGNGLRAFLMILIGHLSDMQAAVGFDHLVYGWVFFSIIMAAIFVIGHYMTDPDNSSENVILENAKQGQQKFPSLVFIVVALLLLCLGPLLKYKYEHNVMVLNESYAVPDLSSSQNSIYSLAKFNKNWLPTFPEADEIYTSVLTPTTVDVFIAKYKVENDSKEIISYKNRFFDANQWTLKRMSTNELVAANGNKIPYNSLTIVNLNGDERKLRVVYKVSNTLSANKIKFKLLQLFNKLMMADLGGEVIVLSTTNIQEADSILDKFMSEHFSTLKQKAMLIKQEVK